MAIDSFAPLYNENQHPNDSALICTKCHTAEHLILESFGASIPPVSGQVALEYSCGKCESFYAHDASVQNVAKFLHTQPAAPDILNVGGKYIHCGEPMKGGEISPSALRVYDDDRIHTPAVSVESTILRCQCGFQISVPIETGAC